MKNSSRTRHFLLLEVLADGGTAQRQEVLGLGELGTQTFSFTRLLGAALRPTEAGTDAK